MIKLMMQSYRNKVKHLAYTSATILSILIASIVSKHFGTLAGFALGTAIYFITRNVIKKIHI